MQSLTLALTHLKYDPNPFLVCPLKLLVSVMLSSYENKDILNLFLKSMLWYFLWKIKGDTYLCFKSLVDHTIPIGVSHIFQSDVVEFGWKKQDNFLILCSGFGESSFGSNKQQSQTSNMLSLCVLCEIKETSNKSTKSWRLILWRMVKKKKGKRKKKGSQLQNKWLNSRKRRANGLLIVSPLKPGCEVLRCKMHSGKIYSALYEASYH